MFTSQKQQRVKQQIIVFYISNNLFPNKTRFPLTKRDSHTHTHTHQYKQMKLSVVNHDSRTPTALFIKVYKKLTNDMSLTK